MLAYLNVLNECSDLPDEQRIGITGGLAELAGLSASRIAIGNLTGMQEEGGLMNEFSHNKMAFTPLVSARINKTDNFTATQPDPRQLVVQMLQNMKT